MAEGQVLVGITFALSAGTPATNDAAGFAALTWTEVGDVLSFDPPAYQATQIDSMVLKTGIKEKYKGSTDYGDLALTYRIAAAGDAGQTLLATAFDSKALYRVRLQREDESAIYYTGRVFEHTPQGGGDADQMNEATASIGLTAKPIAAAAPAP